jgi:hypothetical protein
MTKTAFGTFMTHMFVAIVLHIQRLRLEGCLE